jgi:uncharacterized protein (DUF302 family)
MIELGFHCLMYADNVRYEFKRDYFEILSQIFNRDELNLTNVALYVDFMEVRKSQNLDHDSTALIRNSSIRSAIT